VTSNPTAALERRDPPPPPQRHVTTVESSRAVAEVAAMVRVAQDLPRSIDAAVREMRASCSRLAMARVAFYSFNRGGNDIDGPSADLARELARCWGNMTYGTNEIGQDRVAGESEMQAWAWDVQTNTRRAISFVVPHVRVTNKGQNRTDLTDPADIYYNNQNAAARREREMVLAVLPKWFVDEAVDVCNATLAREVETKPIEVRRREAVEGWDTKGVTRAQLEERIGKPVDEWTTNDMVGLGNLWRSIERRETSLREAFPPAEAERVTRAELAGRDPVVEPGEAKGDPNRVTPAQLRKIGALFTSLGVGGMGPQDTAKRLEVAQTAVDSPENLTVDLSQLTKAQADQLVRTLTAAQEDDQARAVLGLAGGR
jgi:hypothetical protein